MLCWFSFPYALYTADSGFDVRLPQLGCTQPVLAGLCKLWLLRALCSLPSSAKSLFQPVGRSPPGPWAGESVLHPDTRVTWRACQWPCTTPELLLLPCRCWQPHRVNVCLCWPCLGSHWVFFFVIYILNFLFIYIAVAILDWGGLACWRSLRDLLEVNHKTGHTSMFFLYFSSLVLARRKLD